MFERRHNLTTLIVTLVTLVVLTVMDQAQLRRLLSTPHPAVGSLGGYDLRLHGDPGDREPAAAGRRLSVP